MTTLHPFLAAVQAAYDTHGLPDDLLNISVSDCRYTDKVRFSVSMGVARIYAQSTFGHGATLAAAYAECAAKEAVFQAERTDPDGARKALIAAGYSPSLIAA